MKKNNKKGFAIAEILAVTVVIMVIFVTVYSNFFPTTAEFERRVAYNDLESLYATYYMRQLYNDKFSDNDFNNNRTYNIVYDGSKCISSSNNDNCSKIAASLEIEEMIVTSNNITDLKEQVKNNEESVKNISDDLKKYIKYLSTHFTQITTNEQYRIILKTKSGYATSLLNYEKPIEPNKPTLTNYLLPVKYEADGTIKVTSENDSQWYDYDEAKWANAVTIKETAREKYFDSDGYVIANDETKVEESDINTMWVWIPRYNYTVFNYNADGNTAKPIKQIEIHFENTTTPEGTVYCNDDTSNGTSEVCYYKDKTIEKPIEIEGNTYSYGGTASTVNGATYTHPAFCFGNRTIDKDTGNVTCSGTELKGIWVGKYENSLTDNNITILPDKTIYLGQHIADYFIQIKSMELYNNVYGFKQSPDASYSYADEITSNDIIKTDNNDLDTHMMKNSEWGAVTYLTLSKYGIYNKGFSKSGGDYISTQHVAVNTSNITGGGGDISSTTNNKTGIYDMVGGTSELVMASSRPDTNKNYLQIECQYPNCIWSSNADYNEEREYFSNPKYYDLYALSNSETNYKFGKLGDATREVVDWFSERSSNKFVDNSNGKYIFSRGGDWTSSQYNILSYNASSGLGTGTEKIGSRSVLVINPNTNGGKL